MDEDEYTPQKRKEWFEKLGIDGIVVKNFETPLESGMVVVESEELDEDRRAEELEKYRENAGF